MKSSRKITKHKKSEVVKLAKKLTNEDFRKNLGL